MHCEEGAMADVVEVPRSLARDRLMKWDARKDPRVQEVLREHPRSIRKASVFIGLLYKDRKPYVLLTLRSAKLQHHPGSVAFPGGKVDEADGSETAAALREANEEIGLDPSNVEVVCTFPPMIASPNYLTVATVGFIEKEFELRLNKDEVAEAFYLPLERFLEDNHHISSASQRSLSGKPYVVHSFEDTVNGQSMKTWGFTASFCCCTAAVVFNKLGFSSLSSCPKSPADIFEHNIRTIQQFCKAAKSLESAKI